MSHPASFDAELANIAQNLRAAQTPFVLATVIRVAGPTSSTLGAKALLDSEGAILHGWLGGGCTRGAVARIAREALNEGAPKLVSIAPEAQLEAKGVQSGAMVDGIKFARNGCPSGGSIDIFVEPVLPTPELLVLGASPVARALRSLAPNLGWSISDTKHPECTGQKAIVVATQGQGDLDALKSALAGTPDYVAFVGSARKFASLRQKLLDTGLSETKVQTVKAPAGLDIGAKTAEEIALSILAELIQHRHVQGVTADA